MKIIIKYIYTLSKIFQEFAHLLKLVGDVPLIVTNLLLLSKNPFFVVELP